MEQYNNESYPESNYDLPNLIYRKDLSSSIFVIIISVVITIIGGIATDGIFLVFGLIIVVIAVVNIFSVDYDEIQIKPEQIVLLKKNEILYQYDYSAFSEILIKITRHRSKHHVNYRMQLRLYSSYNDYQVIKFKFFISSRRHAVFDEADRLFDFLQQKISIPLKIEEPRSFWR
jgi:cell division protein FtsW (lipid II flippase)